MTSSRPGGDAGAQADQRLRLDVVDLMHHGRLHLRIEERPAGDEVVEDGAERVHVGAAVDGAAVELLGRHVGERADAMDLRHVRAEVQDAAEIADLDVGDRAVGQHREQVGRLDVAVDQALAVDVAERHRALEADLDDQLEREQLVGAAVRAQRAAGDVLHDQIGRDRVGNGVEDLDDVGMLEPADERRFGGEEPLRIVAVDRIARGSGAHALDRDVPALEVVVAEEDLARRAVAEAADDAVLADVRRHRRDPGRSFGSGGGGAAGDGHGAARRDGHSCIRPARGATAPSRRLHLIHAWNDFWLPAASLARSPRRIPSMMSAREELLDALRAAMAEVSPGHTLAAAFETPKQADHGDLAVTAAMPLAKAQRRNPREVAAELIAALRAKTAVERWVESIAVAGPGLHQPASARRGAPARRRRGARRRRRLRHAAAERRSGHRRVRLGQPDRPAARRPRAPGRARRRDLQPARDAGPPRRARVLLQRRRRPDRDAGGVGEGAARRAQAR